MSMVGRETGACQAARRSAPFNTKRSETPRFREAIEEPFQGEVLEEFLEWTPLYS